MAIRHVYFKIRQLSTHSLGNGCVFFVYPVPNSKNFTYCNTVYFSGLLFSHKLFIHFIWNVRTYLYICIDREREHWLEEDTRAGATLTKPRASQ